MDSNGLSNIKYNYSVKAKLNFIIFSVQGIDNIGHSLQGLQVNIPEEQAQNNNEEVENPQPPSYQEAISSKDDQPVENKD